MTLEEYEDAEEYIIRNLGNNVAKRIHEEVIKEREEYIKSIVIVNDHKSKEEDAYDRAMRGI